MAEAARVEDGGAELPRLYRELADWWPLLSDPSDYADEAAAHWSLIQRSARRPVRRVLELGSGGGNNAVHMKRHARLTLVDLSPGMLKVSRRLNPECEHVPGDMRSVRLGRRFDAVFVHDAVMYMRTREELLCAAVTAREHCESGAAAVFVPDYVRETFKPESTCGGHDEAGEPGPRGLRYLDWIFDPDPLDHEYASEMVYILREGDRTRVEHERHRFGLFSLDEWREVLTEAGFAAAREPSTHGRWALVGVRA